MNQIQQTDPHDHPTEETSPTRIKLVAAINKCTLEIQDKKIDEMYR